MSEVAGEHLEEEPQAERGPTGSRDTGSDEPGGGPVDRPEGTTGDDTAVNSQDAQDSDTHLPTGDGG